jgi:hypothetical protein
VQIVVDDLVASRADAKGRDAKEFVNEDVLREFDKEDPSNHYNRK